MAPSQLESLEGIFWRVIHSIFSRWVKMKQGLAVICEPSMQKVKEFNLMLEKGWDLNLIMTSVSLAGIAFMLGFLAGLLFG